MVIQNLWRKAFLAKAEANKVARTEWDNPVHNFVSKRPVAFRVVRTVDWEKDERRQTKSSNW